MEPDFDAVYFRGIRIEKELLLSMHQHLPADQQERWQDIIAEHSG
jgi:hypothetical protein